MALPSMGLWLVKEDCSSLNISEGKNLCVSLFLEYSKRMVYGNYHGTQKAYHGTPS